MPVNWTVGDPWHDALRRFAHTPDNLIVSPLMKLNAGAGDGAHTVQAQFMVMKNSRNTAAGEDVVV